jgi:hypothetical protein
MEPISQKAIREIHDAMSGSSPPATKSSSNTPINQNTPPQYRHHQKSGNNIPDRPYHPDRESQRKPDEETVTRQARGDGC